MLKERNIQKILNSIEVKDTMGGVGGAGGEPEIRTQRQIENRKGKI